LQQSVADVGFVSGGIAQFCAAVFQPRKIATLLTLQHFLGEQMSGERRGIGLFSMCSQWFQQRVQR